MKRIAMFSLFALMLILVSGCGKKADTNTNQIVANANATNQSANMNVATNTNEALPEGGILVEAGTGTLTNEGSYSYIGESARGEEAYLGDATATATYTVKAETAGTYTLWVRLTDDGVHENGARSVSVSVNNISVLKYSHISEDTKGWKWFSLGNVSLKEGNNAIAFIKDADTYAAYTMDSFKLIPLGN